MAVGLSARRLTWNYCTRDIHRTDGRSTMDASAAAAAVDSNPTITRSVSVDFAGLRSTSVAGSPSTNAAGGTRQQYETANKLLSRQLSKQEEHLHLRHTMTIKGRIYNLLERPVGLRSFSYHCAAFFLVLICLTFSVLSTIEDFAYFANTTLFWMELVMVIVFGIEYVLRLWAAGCCGKYVGFWGRLRYIRKPICVIDVMVMSASAFVLSFGSNDQMFATSAIRGIRFLQIMRMLRVDRHGGTWRLLGSVVYVHRQELITTLYIGFIGLVFSSYFVFLAEKDVQAEDGNADFTSFADALWWGVATFTTIGYGDKVPRTWMGRLVTSFFSLVIISFITLPSGILGSGFALKVQQKQRQKHFSRQFPSAATLIQCAWRCHAAEKTHWSEATWKIHLKPSAYSTALDAAATAAGQSLPSNGATNKKMSIVYRLKTIRSKSENSTPVDKRKKYHSWHENNAFDDASEASADRTNAAEATQTTTTAAADGSISEPDTQNGNMDAIESADEIVEDGKTFTTLTEAHKNAIRAIRKLKYFVARRNFSMARKPYDVQDVIEQYSQGHLNMMFRIKELQRRLEKTIGKPANLHGVADPNRPVTTITSRLLKLEIKTTNMDKKLDHMLAILSAPALQQTSSSPQSTSSAQNHKQAGLIEETH